MKKKNKFNRSGYVLTMSYLRQGRKTDAIDIFLGKTEKNQFDRGKIGQIADRTLTLLEEKRCEHEK